MKERPILFKAPMVRAILDGSKTQTRRVIKPTQPLANGMWPAGRDPVPDCPYGQPGDRLLVASEIPGLRIPRILLEITDVRVERLQDISEADCAKEGAPFSYSGFDPDEAPDWRGWYRHLWESIKGPDSWVANPWVWVIEFRRVGRQTGGTK